MGLKKSCLLLLLFFIDSPVSAQWDKYPTYQQYLDIMAKFQADYPQLCKIEEFGTSVKDKKLLAAKISDNVAIDEAEPAVLFLSSIHGDELGGYVTTLHLIDSLLSSYGKDSLVTKLVDNIEIWINPLANPDGTFKGGDNTVTGAIRYNANNVDLNRTFPDTNGISQQQIQKETDAIIKFCDAHKFIMSVDFHAGTEGIFYPGYGRFVPDTPDEAWFCFIQKMWHDLTGWSLPPDPQYVMWSRMDHAYFHQRCRAVVAEVLVRKIVFESDLIGLWDKLKYPLLFHLEQALFGIRGIITDSLTGDPLKAKIFVENHDKDSSWVFSHLPHGDYYRPIIQGTYAVTFSAPGYIPRTVTGIEVKNNTATVLDVKLIKDPTHISVYIKTSPDIKVMNHNGSILISYTNQKNLTARISIIDMYGKSVRKLTHKAVDGKRTVVWDGFDACGRSVSNGCYAACVETGDSRVIRTFIFVR